MKRRIFVSIALLLASVVIIEASDDNMMSRHYVELSVGEPLSTMMGFNLQTPFDNEEKDMRAVWQQESVSDRSLPRKCYNDGFLVMPISVGYFYQVLDWLQVGGEVATYSSGESWNSFADSRKVAYYNNTNLYLAAGVRFNYFHKNITDLYSGCLVGANVRFFATENDPLYYVSGRCAWQITALGVRFGKKVYGNVEIGYGYKGFCSVGIGVRI